MGVVSEKNDDKTLAFPSDYKYSATTNLLELRTL